jgi:hypothetical protein
MSLHKLKIIFFLLLFSIGIISNSLAQGNLSYADERFIHFGYSLGMNMMDFGITSHSVDVRVSSLKPGFSVGVITDLRLNRYLNLRFNPTLNFGERELSYNFKDSATISIQSIPICFPIYLKYSAERKGNYRPYLLWGAGIAIDLATNKENPVLLKPFDYYTEFGVGCDLYFSFFKLCPELKYSIGFNDIFVPVNKRDAGNLGPINEKYSSPLTRLTSHMLTLAFNFE